MAWYSGEFNVPRNTGGDCGTMTAQWFVDGTIGSNLSLKLRVKSTGTYSTGTGGYNTYHPNMKLFLKIDGGSEVTTNTRGSNSLWLDSLQPYQTSYLDTSSSHNYQNVKNATASGNTNDWAYNVGKAFIVKVQARDTSSANGCNVTNNQNYRGFLFTGSPTTSFYQIDANWHTIYISNIRIYTGGTSSGTWKYAIPYIYTGGTSSGTWKKAYPYVYTGGTSSGTWKLCRA